VTACTFVVASALLITVPLLTSIRELTDDPGLDPGVKAGIAQAGDGGLPRHLQREVPAVP